MSELQPWCVVAWPSVECPVTDRHLIIRSLMPAAGVDGPPAALQRPLIGQALWSCDTVHGPVGLAWDWVELRPGVIAMVDPMSVLSNLQFVDAGGRRLSASRRIIELNNVIASLPWQTALGRDGASSAPAALPLAA